MGGLTDYCFFLSYARSSAAGEAYLRRFHKQLAEEIRHIAGLPAEIPPERIGFLDTGSVEPGENWPKAVAEALETTRVLVCLYSRPYFNSEYCGKEFEAFRARLLPVGQENSQVVGIPPLIVPVLWDPPNRLPRPLPASVADIHYDHASLGDVYAHEGLRHLMSLAKYRDRYREVLMRFAETIVRRAEAHPLSSSGRIASLRETVSAWDAIDQGTAPDVPAGTTTPSSGMVVTGLGSADSVPETSRSRVDTDVPRVHVDVAVELVPHRSKGRLLARHKLLIGNRGNRPATARLTAADPTNALTFSFDPESMLLEPGTEARSNVRVRPRQRLWDGRPRTLPFEVTAEIDGGRRVRAEASMVQGSLFHLWTLGVIAILVVLSIALFVSLAMWPQVPSVASLSEEAATRAVERAGFTVSLITVADPQVRPGIVIKTDPQPGDRRRKGTTIKVFISVGPNPTVLPDVVGLDEADAKARLATLGFTKVLQVSEFNNAVAKGKVITTEPSGNTPWAKELAVTLHVSSGPRLPMQQTRTPSPKPTAKSSSAAGPAPKVSVPDCRGTTYANCERRITEVGLKPRVIREPSDRPRDVVIDTNPSSGEKVDKDSPVTVRVSAGPAPKDWALPNLVNTYVVLARQQLLDAGMKMEEAWGPSNVPRGNVIQTEPPRGTSLEAGSTVKMFVSSGSKPDAVVFDRLRSGKETELFIKTPPDGSESSLLRDPGDDFACSWSADGKKIAFTSSRSGSRHIWTKNADGTGLKDVSELLGRGTDDNPDWSPEGTKIAFRSFRAEDGGSGDVYVVNADGTGLRRLTRDSGLDNQPAWSPDGTQIAFVSNRGGGRLKIYLMDTNGNYQRRLTHVIADEEETDPDWSPDGKQIVFTNRKAGNSNIYVINVDGTRATPLTTDPSAEFLPAWSSDNLIAFVSNRNGNNEIYVMNYNDTEPTRITVREAPEDTTRNGASSRPAEARAAHELVRRAAGGQ